MTAELGQLQGRLAAPTLLVTKLHPPFVPAQVVTRERLFGRLREAQRARLSLVACPAGFGKSTLLAAWREHESRERPVGWVSVDEGDNDAVVLWLHVVEALARVCPQLDGGALAATFAAAPHVEVALPRLVNALAEQPPVALVLDDFHRLTSRSTRETVAWFVDRLPPNVQLVIASRTDPALPLGTLRARGQLLELRADDLRFSREEADEFLNERLELELTEEDIALLVGRTEGWPAGIYLAALSLTGKDDKSALVREFDGASAHVVDFLAGEVLAGFEPELQTFMLRTSVLERLCVPLCDAVLGAPGAAATQAAAAIPDLAAAADADPAPGSAAALATLAHSNLFLIPLDDQRRWYRFHHLFAQILRLELERREPGTAPDLHRRAFHWHAASGTTGEAIHHAVAAGEFDAAGVLISESWNEHANAGRIRSILEWLDAFPETVLGCNHELLLVKAWAAAMVGRRDDELAALDQALALPNPPTGPLRDGFGSFEASVVLLRATFAWGDVSAILKDGARSAELEPPGSPFRPVTTWALGWGHFCNGDLDEATRWLEETTRIAPPAEQWIVGLAAMGDLSLIAGMRGHRDEQLRIATEAMDLMHEVGLADAVEIGEVHTAYGVALAAHGRHIDAKPHLEHGVFVRRIWAQDLDLIDGLLGLAPTVAALGDARRADELLEESAMLVDRCADPGALPARLAEARAIVRAATASGLATTSGVASTSPPSTARRVMQLAQQPAARPEPTAANPADPEPAPHARAALPEPLSERELVVLRLLRSGLSEREIGNELFISFNTVHSHVKSVYRKLGVSSRAAAVARASDEQLF